MFDSHCHLNVPPADSVPEIVARCQEHGMFGVLVVGYDLPSSQIAVSIAERWHAPGFTVGAAVGVSPHEAATWNSDSTGMLQALAQSPRVCAIGEIGLDYYYKDTPPEQQHVALRAQLQLAHNLDLPVVIHLRDADDDLFTMIGEYTDRQSGVLHCFTSTAESMQRGVELGLHVSLSGIVTFKKSDALRAVARQIPAERLLIETDAPWLAPQPWRGKDCEPWMVRHTAEIVARERGCSTEELIALTAQNARALFRLEDSVLV